MIKKKATDADISTLKCCQKKQENLGRVVFTAYKMIFPYLIQAHVKLNGKQMTMEFESFCKCDRKLSLKSREKENF